jgi:hypothetical protein
MLRVPARLGHEWRLPQFTPSSRKSSFITPTRVEDHMIHHIRRFIRMRNHPPCGAIDASRLGACRDDWLERGTFRRIALRGTVTDEVAEVLSPLIPGNRERQASIPALGSG